MLDPESKGVAQVNAEQSLSRVLAYRVWADQRRGWRFTNPNLEELGLVRAEYVSLDDLAADDAAFVNAPPELRLAKPETRQGCACRVARSSCAMDWQSRQTRSIRLTSKSTANAARQNLRDPWAISAQEEPRVAAALIIDAPRRAEVGLRGEPLMVRGGPRSRLARQLGHPRIWGKRLDSKTYLEVVAALLSAAAEYQLVSQVATPFDVDGWRLAANAIRLVSGAGT